MKVLEEYNAHDVLMSEIFSDDEFNCRGRIIPLDVLDLAKSIKETKLQQPIAVQPFKHPTNPNIKYRIIAGHRRFMAFVVNKSTTIPAIIRDGLSELDARLLNLTENLKRQDLNMLQEASLKKADLTRNIIIIAALSLLALLYTGYGLKQRHNRKLQLQQKEINQQNLVLKNVLKEQKKHLRIH